MKLVTTNVDTKLPRVISRGIGNSVLELVSVSHLALRQIHTQSDRCSRWTSVETAQAEFDDFHRRNQLGTRIQSERSGCAAQKRATRFVDPLRRQDAGELQVHTLRARRHG